MTGIEKKIAEIAEKELNIETLETRNRDALDFHEVSVWGLKEALEKAYKAGVEDTKKKIQGKLEGFDPSEPDLKKCHNFITQIYGMVTLSKE